MKCTSEPDDAGETDEYKRDAFQQRQVEHLCDDGTEMIQSIVVSVSHWQARHATDVRVVVSHCRTDGTRATWTDCRRTGRPAAASQPVR